MVLVYTDGTTIRPKDKSITFILKNYNGAQITSDQYVGYGTIYVGALCMSKLNLNNATFKRARFIMTGVNGSSAQLSFSIGNADFVFPRSQNSAETADVCTSSWFTTQPAQNLKIPATTGLYVHTVSLQVEYTE